MLGGDNRMDNYRKNFTYFGDLLLHKIENQNKIKKELVFGGEGEPILKPEDYRKIRVDTVKQKIVENINKKEQHEQHEQKEQQEQQDVSINNSDVSEEISLDNDNNDNGKNDSNNYDDNSVNDNSVNDNSVNDNVSNDNSMDAVNKILREDNSGMQVSVNRHHNLQKIDAKTEDINELKREILFKFKILKKSYPMSKIPQFSMSDSYKLMKGTYDDTIHMLTIDSNVESYKSYLLGGFMLTEFLFGKYFNFDMSGFCQQQILQMNQYNKLLIELGEKTYVPKSSWPVEARIVVMIIMNAGMFVVSKLILKNTGSDLLNMMQSLNMNSARVKKKMKSPDVNLDEL
jgi:hypothetical protein